MRDHAGTQAGVAQETHATHLHLRLTLLLSLLVLLLGLQAGSGLPRAVAQDAFLIRYTGSIGWSPTANGFAFGISGGSLPDGTVVSVLTARSLTDTTVCASTTVSAGSYSVDIPLDPDPNCDYRSWAASFPDDNPVFGPCAFAHAYLFVVQGQRVGTDCPVQTLMNQSDGEGSLAPGQTQTLDLSYTATAQTLAAQLATPPPVALPVAQVLGTVQLLQQGSAEPVAVPQGAGVLIYNTDTDTICGRGTVLDDQNDYEVNILPLAGCTGPTNYEGLAHFAVFLADIITTQERYGALEENFCWILEDFGAAMLADFHGQVDSQTPAGSTTRLRSELSDPANLLTGGTGVTPGPNAEAPASDMSPGTDVETGVCEVVSPPSQAPSDLTARGERPDTGQWLMRTSSVGRPPAGQQAAPPRRICGSTTFAQAVRSCLDSYRLLATLYKSNPQRSPDLQPIADVMAFYDQPNPATSYTIRGDPTRAFSVEPAITKEDGETGKYLQGIPVNTVTFMALPGAFDIYNQTYHQGQHVEDFCGSLMHELLHAMDFATGTRARYDLTCTYMAYDGSPQSLSLLELRARAAENAYRNRQPNLSPLRDYNGIPLPNASIIPTAQSWQRLQAIPSSCH